MQIHTHAELDKSGKGVQILKPMKTLIADDHEWFRKEMHSYLDEQEGIQVIGEVNDGLEAVSCTKLLHPDLVMLDISMPRMNGFEAARQIKEYSPSTRVVIVTIHENETYQVFAQMMNVDGYVCKSSLKHDLPVILEELRHHD